MENRRKAYLQLLDIPIWRRQKEKVFYDDVVNPNEESLNSSEHSVQSIKSSLQDLNRSFNYKSKTENLSPEVNIFLKQIETQDEEQSVSLGAQIRECKRCSFASMRLNPVVGRGNSDRAKLFCITDVPLKNEMFAKKIIEGDAERLFKQMLKTIQVDYCDVYMTPFIKCRPDELVESTENEKKACFYFLEQEIKLAKPQVILLLGRTVSQLLLETHKPYQELCEITHELKIAGQNYPVFVAPSPSLLLNDHRLKRIAWNSFKRIADYLESDTL